MKKQNYYLLLFILLTSLTVFSQETEYVIVKELKNKVTANIFEVKKTVIKTQKYENREIDNPKYLRFERKIDSLNKEIEILKGVKYSDNQRQHLVNAKNYLEKAIHKKKKEINLDNVIDGLFSGGSKWKNLKLAKKELNNTNISFTQPTKGKYSVALKKAKQNVLKIDDLLGNSVEKQNLIQSLNSQKRNLLNKISSNGRIGYLSKDRIQKKIRKDIPIGEIEREVLLLDTINVFSKITGKFVAVNNEYGVKIESYYQLGKGYRIMKNDFKHFMKNELVPLDTIKKYIPFYRNQKELTIRILNHSHRYQDKKKYLIKSVGNEKLYFTNDNALSKIALKESDYKILKDNNIKIIEETHEHWKNRKTIYAVKNGQKCVYTEYIKHELLNGNTNIIQQTVSAVKHYNIYSKQALKALDIVNKHRQSYNSRTMTASRLSKWKTDLNKLISIDKKMDDIHYGKYKNSKTSDLAYQYHRGFSKQLTREETEVSIAISDMIRECKILTGI
ncbi:hypothetical protein G1L01_11455 [Tenacibaculum finnmarkense]|uniref:hypothetical protein n=1 Tax=Tenacibaculum finnmarkense TaxID=2781243 RepID=UPI001EFB040E|nr:hypothetical protein [Tenacibaculum finnmarkense]MCG8203235.1 hypothetical protein [Tenacibaculum finnmarkense genomovar finnmarkense]MCG8881077.1 hypothetical protein [Tenacibaculum finnmarkense]MCM8865990.1 hypothetical protein [Tenacibaculum finnmarkense genomovar finnmarkense]MCM8896611.1 hypothetical protein [Tenacibaculum finnmarkense genomovar finnmarkense]